MTYPLIVATRKADRCLRVGLFALWIWILIKAGPQALGYALLALFADIQDVLFSGQIKIPTRHPDGWTIELSAESLRAAWWIDPHLRHADSLFVSGGLLSVILWLLRLAYMGQIRSRFDPVFSARVDRWMDVIEAGAHTIRLAAAAALHRAARSLTRKLPHHRPVSPPRLSPARVPLDTPPLQQAPSPSPVPTVSSVDDPSGSAADIREAPQDGHPPVPATATPNSMADIPAIASSSGSNAAPVGTPPPSPPSPHPASFFTKF
ncbi:hypothetical protein [Brevundimonas sp.]|uniref:hypothetical protein n=1 Tax=Brevundimonas sp. TaxID=1871086 RepID=UPI00391DF6C6